jgi:hypothetical protein
MPILLSSIEIADLPSHGLKLKNNRITMIKCNIPLYTFNLKYISHNSMYIMDVCVHFKIRAYNEGLALVSRITVVPKIVSFLKKLT